MEIPLEAGRQIPEEIEQWTPDEILGWAFERWHPRIAIASAFGAEGMVLIDIAARIRRDFRIFTLDTGFLFSETYALMEQVQRRYGISVERCEPSLPPKAQARVFGDALWLRDPNRCCEMRKVEPLRKKLAGISAWITAIRRDQSAARANAPKIHWDAKFGLVKLNPLADWSWQQVWDYIRENDVPYNPLHDRGYPSIGCTHCTRAVQQGEGLRAGRWPGFAKMECGLHSKE